MSKPCIGALILAGGKGTRMYSSTPKVLQRILEMPLLHYVYAALTPLCNDQIWTIVGHKAEMVTAAFPAHATKALLQRQQLGTGHALQTAWPAICEAGVTHLLVVNGDTPQLDTKTLHTFLEASVATTPCQKQPDLSVVTITLLNPGSFGRVVRKDNDVIAIVEAKDYVPEVHGIDPKEVNAGIYCLRTSAIHKLLPLLSNKNKGNEFYITDLVALAVAQDMVVAGFSLGTDCQFMGVNNPLELIQSEEEIRKHILAEHQKNHVLIRAPDSVRIGPQVSIAKGADITGPCELYGATCISEGVVIESHCKITDSTIGKDTRIASYSLLHEATVATSCTIGPYARLRPGAKLDENAHIGNFVEIKKSHIGSEAKINHLSYIGDAIIGSKTNIGAGTITCNYDGVKKHTTTIGEHAFIGSNTALVAPVTIGDNALVGAGSVITKNVPAGKMGIARERQVNLDQKK